VCICCIDDIFASRSKVVNLEQSQGHYKVNRLSDSETSGGIEINATERRQCLRCITMAMPLKKFSFTEFIRWMPYERRATADLRTKPISLSHRSTDQKWQLYNNYIHHSHLQPIQKKIKSWACKFATNPHLPVRQYVQSTTKRNSGVCTKTKLRLIRIRMHTHLQRLWCTRKVQIYCLIFAK